MSESFKKNRHASHGCPPVPCSAWVSVDDELPPEGKYVLVHLTKDNWKDSEDPEGVYCKVAKLRRGISLKEREAMQRGDLPRSAMIRAEDEHGNNQRPYNWQNFGPGDFWGQEVDYWMLIPSLPNAQGRMNDDQTVKKNRHATPSEQEQINDLVLRFAEGYFGDLSPNATPRLQTIVAVLALTVIRIQATLVQMGLGPVLGISLEGKQLASSVVATIAQNQDIDLRDVQKMIDGAKDLGKEES